MTPLDSNHRSFSEQRSIEQGDPWVEAAGESRRVGVIGLGRMGYPIARRLLGKNIPIRVCASSAKADHIARLGGVLVSDMASIVHEADVIVTCLPTPEIVRHVYDQVMKHSSSKSLLIDHSTVDRRLSVELAQQASACSARFLDAPLSGGPSAAWAGRLTAMVGGSTETYLAARDFLLSYCGQIFHCGPPGAGSAVKLINQVLVSAYALAAAEAEALAKALAIPRHLFAEVLPHTSGQSPIALRRFVSQDDVAVSAPLWLLLKDIQMVVDAANTSSLELPLSNEVFRIIARLVETGHANEDMVGFSGP